MEIALIVLAAALVVAAVLIARRPSAGDPRVLADLARTLGADAESQRGLQMRVDQTAAQLSSLAGAFEERRRLEEQSTDAVLRIERLVAGSYSRGRAGENLLHAVLSEFPPDMVVHDFTIGGRACEFALKMPDGKVMPIDSKWTAAGLVQELESTADLSQREAVRRRVEAAVASRLKEVARYIDPTITTPMAVVALPDPIYSCCRRVHATAADLRITVVAHSSAAPVLLTIWNLYRSFAREVDSERMLSRLHELSVTLGEAEDRLEGHLARGLKQANNAAFELRSLLASAQSAVSAIAPSREDPATITQNENGNSPVEFSAKAV